MFWKSGHLYPYAFILFKSSSNVSHKQIRLRLLPEKVYKAESKFISLKFMLLI